VSTPIFDTCSVRASAAVIWPIRLIAAGGELSTTSPFAHSSDARRARLPARPRRKRHGPKGAAGWRCALVFDRLFLAVFAVIARIRTVFADKGYDA